MKKREFFGFLCKVFITSLSMELKKMILSSCPYCTMDSFGCSPFQSPMMTIMGEDCFVVCENCKMRGPVKRETVSAAYAWNKLPRVYSDTRVYDSVKGTLSNIEKQKSDPLEVALKDVPRGTTFSVDKKK